MIEQVPSKIWTHLLHPFYNKLDYGVMQTLIASKGAAQQGAPGRAGRQAG